MILPEEFGPFLTEQRKKHRLTQAQLAEKLHVSVSAISKWERGLCLPEVSKLEDIAAALELTLMEVMQCRKAAPENTATVQETDHALSDAIRLTKSQEKSKLRRQLLAVTLAAVLAVLLYCFPVYHVLQVWSPDYYTTGEVGKLLSIGSSKDRDTARLFLAQANAAFADLTTPYAELEAKHGLLQRYATASEREAVTQRHSLRLWSAHFDAADGYGYVWVCYSNSAYDADGEEVWGCRKVASLWIFEKDAKGVWQLVRIKEHA